MAFRRTREVTRLLGVSVALLAKALWTGRVDPRQESPAGNFLGTEGDMERASWALHRRAFKPQDAVPV